MFTFPRIPLVSYPQHAMNPPPIDNEIRPGSIVQPLDKNDARIAVGADGWFEGRVASVALGVARVKIFAGPAGLVGEEKLFHTSILWKSGAKP